VAMLEHAYYAVISPEGCASILWKDSSQKERAASALKMQAEDLLESGVIDLIIEEPLGGAHHDPHEVYQNVKRAVIKQQKLLSAIPMETLLEKRYQKFRKIGKHETSS
jgi:acetyl-CoA carboxylase carboxyl transferase subunit alpha